jgi:heptose I phosphotransferase
LRQQPDWARFAGPDWADHILETAVTDRFHAKQGRSIGRWVLSAEGRRLVVYLKRHYRLPWWHGLLATLWPEAGWSPALREWDHLEWARAEGLPVPVAVAGGEFIGPWCRLQSVLAVEELTGMLPLHEAVPAAAARLDADAFRRWKRGLVAEMARLTRALHQRRRFHKDLYLCHFYIAADDTRRVAAWRGRVRMIDLHRLGHHPWTWPWWQAKDLAQLLYSSDVAGVTARDRLWFWRVYRGAGRPGWAARWTWRLVRLRAWRYRRHSRQRHRRGAPGGGVQRPAACA